MNNDAVSQAIIRLFDQEMFYAELVTRMKRVLTKSVPVAGVCIKDHIELHINLEAFSKFTIEERAAILKHECEHILRNHIARAKELAPEVYAKKQDGIDRLINGAKHQVINIAADAAANSGLRHLPEGAVYPEKLDLPSHETLEFYLEALKQKQKDKPDSQDGEDDGHTIDNHELWGESEGEKDILKEKVRQLVTKAADKTRAAGKMTAENELAVSTLNENKVNWKEQLKRFVAKTITSHIESSKKKRNRRYGIMFPGSVKIEDLHIGVAMDTSGSISDDELQQFITEISFMAKYAKITVVEADSSIKASYEFKPKQKYNIKGRGGTAYQPALDFFNNMKDIDGVIYFGDMDNYDNETLVKPKYPVLWVIVGAKDKPCDFGTQIRIK